MTLLRLTSVPLQQRDEPGQLPCPFIPLVVKHVGWQTPTLGVVEWMLRHTFIPLGPTPQSASVVHAYASWQ